MLQKDARRKFFVGKNGVVVGGLFCLIASMSWGAMFPVAEGAFQRIDPIYFSFFRYLIGSLLLAVILLMKEGKSAFRLEGKGKSLVFFGSMAFTVYNLLVFLGQSSLPGTGTIIASLMEAMMPMISVLVFWIYKHKTPNRFTMISMLVSFAGALLVITKGDLHFLLMAKSSLLPVGVIFAGVIGWVIYTMGGNHFPTWSALRYSTLSCLFGTIVSLIVVSAATALGFLSFPALSTILSVKYELAFMVLLPGIAALLCWNAGIKLLTPLNGILFINFVPLTTLAILVFQGYHITMVEVMGTFLVIAALLFNNLSQRRSQQKKSVKLVKAIT